MNPSNKLLLASMSKNKDRTVFIQDLRIIKLEFLLLVPFKFENIDGN
jgi:hypothetical protein